MKITRISPCLWFADEAEEAAHYYTSIFKDSKIVSITRYGTAGFDIHQRPAGSVMTVDFDLNGVRFTALNGGPVFTFNEAVSFQIICQTQDEVDYYWQKLTAGGDPNAQQCGWLKDRFGLSWQVVPEGMNEMMKDPQSEAASRVMTAMLKMKKLDLNELKQAYAGQV